ncbi:DUF1684 domain-containing protein [Arundinibacter roseus]|uniref:DUF1684 domain-containing protein n=1 Tax=Arundinibacter roseus TaxID=2070510 RepID=A0A4R4KBR4_9BACT|nr:DUF1684 domain-containing protein [Arundinibacter roseus]TDB65238.1 DUF1684 domain-containing protein [Arundinibacter roseus]
MKSGFTAKITLAFCLTFGLLGVHAQSFQHQTEEHREKYKQEFLTSENSPLKEADLEFLRFFEPDSSFQVHAKFVKTTGSEPFSMPTYSGQQKEYIKFGELHFTLHGQLLTLAMYRSLSLMQVAAYRDYLFVPFKDPTNGEETYGGGRYMDFRLKDISETGVLLDFNKAYNPYCAYSDGYNCPIPPKENHLSLEIRAGEKGFGKEH